MAYIGTGVYDRGKIKMPIYIDTSADIYQHKCRHISAQVSTIISNFIFLHFFYKEFKQPLPANSDSGVDPLSIQRGFEHLQEAGGQEKGRGMA
ncbi:hypothetical protein D0T51_04795 [Parabacteroides sp. 52]|nr:hypothetical protein [Parabacteroides sp. 52]